MGETMTEKPLSLHEATIDELYRAICVGEITCIAVVEHYLARVQLRGRSDAASKRRVPPPAFPQL